MLGTFPYFRIIDHWIIISPVFVIILVMFSNLARNLQRTSSILIGLGSFYPLAWLSTFFLAPQIGRAAAHDHILTHLFTYVGVGGLLIGSFILIANMYLGLFNGNDARSD